MSAAKPTVPLAQGFRTDSDHIELFLRLSWPSIARWQPCVNVRLPTIAIMLRCA
jgi:hypothetical protein